MRIYIYNKKIKKELLLTKKEKKIKKGLTSTKKKIKNKKIKNPKNFFSLKRYCRAYIIWYLF